MTSGAQKIADRLIDVAAGTASASVAAEERRRRRRLPFNAPVAVVLIDPTGHRSHPLVLRANDLSHDGMCVVSKAMMYPGSRGAVQLVRSNGEVAVIGIEVRHCRYVGAMQHHVGLKFAPLTHELPSSTFLDKRGRMILLDPALKPDAE